MVMSADGEREWACGPVVAEIAGIMPASEFDQLPDALTALLREIAGLKVYGWHRDFVEGCLGWAGAVETIAGELRTRPWILPLYVDDVPGDGPREITIRLAQPDTPS